MERVETHHRSGALAGYSNRGDARLSPTVTNQLAEEKPFTWFKSNMIHTVPLPYAGFGRRVYPGFVQLYSFMSMNEDRHRDAHWSYFNSLIAGEAIRIEDHGVIGDLRTVAQDVRGRFGDAAAAVALVSTAGAKPVVVVATTQAARDAGVKAGALVKAAATALGGGGGGKDDLAQGGGSDASRAEAAMSDPVLSLSTWR